MINSFMYAIQYINEYNNVIVDAFSRVCINLEVLPTITYCVTIGTRVTIAKGSARHEH